MATLSLPERFDFSAHKNFTEQYTKILSDGKDKQVVLDFSKVEYLDSAALGMLVLLNKRAREHGCSVEIINAKGTAKDVLEIANFHRLMTIR